MVNLVVINSPNLKLLNLYVCWVIFSFSLLIPSSSSSWTFSLSSSFVPFRIAISLWGRARTKAGVTADRRAVLSFYFGEFISTYCGFPDLTQVWWCITMMTCCCFMMQILVVITARVCLLAGSVGGVLAVRKVLSIFLCADVHMRNLIAHLLVAVNSLTLSKRSATSLQAKHMGRN